MGQSDIHAPESGEPVHPGDRVLHYRIVDLLGHGGMGIVYRARDVRLDREIALKCPRADLREDSVARHRFLRESRAASRLTHPNIVPVFDVFEANGIPWIAMELIEGPRLDERLHDGLPLPLEEILRHAEELTDAVATAHAHGILHRDLKPGNVLIGRDGRARITDFGLARFLPSPDSGSVSTTVSSSLTMEGRVVGTPQYMAPEQLLGGTVDARSDLYALGVLLYEMSTGRPAFPPSSQWDALATVLRREPVAIARLNYEVPPELERIVRKAIAKRPEERYQSAGDMLADLRSLRRRIAAGDYEPDEAWAPGRRWRRRRTVAFALTAAVLAAVAFVVGRFVGSGAGEPPGVIPRQVTTGTAGESHPAIAPDGTLVAYVSDEAGSPDVWLVDARGGNPLRLTDDPAEDTDPAWFPDGASIAFVSDRGGREAVWRVPALGGSATLIVPDAVDPAISRDGRRIAFARPGPSGALRIAVADLGNPASIRLLTGDADGTWSHTTPAWSPDGTTLAYAEADGIRLIPASGGASRRLPGTGRDSHPVWTADGRALLVSSLREETQALWRVPIDGGPATRLTLGAGPEADPSTDRTGSHLAFTTEAEDPDVAIRNLRGAAEHRIRSMRLDYSPALAAGGEFVVFVTDRWGGAGALAFQSLRDGRPTGPIKRLTDFSVGPPAVSPDGRWIAFHRAVGGERDIWILPAEGGEARRFTETAAVDIHPAWSPDGSRLAYVSTRDGRSRVWIEPVAAGRPSGAARPLDAGEHDAACPSWSPDGRAIVYLDEADDGVDVWLARVDRHEAAKRVTHDGGVLWVRFEATGAALWVAGSWGGRTVELRRVLLDGSRAESLSPPLVMGRGGGVGPFDVSRDGRVIAYGRQEPAGDVWVLQSAAATY